MAIQFGPQCSAQLVSVGANQFANYFNLTEQAGATCNDPSQTAECNENFTANWRKAVKHDIINCGGERSMFDFMTSAFPMGDTQPIDTKTKYFKSQCAMNYNIQATAAVTGITGAAVTFQLARKDHSANGTMSPVKALQRLLIKNDNSIVTVTSVNTTTPYAHTVTVTPSPDYAISISANNPMMIIPAPAVDSYSCHTVNTRLPNQGHIYKMGMKIIRLGWEVPYDSNLYCDQLQFAKGINPVTGMAIDMWTTAAKEIARQDMLLTKHTDLLLGVKSTDQTLIDNCLEGFNGLIPSIRYGGGNVIPWNPIYGLNPKTDLAVIIAQADQTKSFKEYYCTCGFQYYAEMEDALVRLIGNNPGACTYQTFMRSGAVDKQYVEQYQIKSLSVLGYTFHFFVAGAFTDIRTIGSDKLGNTAIYYPSQRVKDSAGNDVAPIDMYTYATPGFNGTFQDVIRDMMKINGCTMIEGDLMEGYGAAFHCLKDWYLHDPKTAC